MIRPKFCVQVLVFNVDSSILQMIENCGPYVDKIYAAWSNRPWTYNPQARGQYVNPTQLDILKQSVWFEKIQILEGDWNTEEDQRNACLDAARSDGMSYMVIQDADEFYTEEAYKANLEAIVNNPNHSWYTVPWCTYWKTTKWCVVNASGSVVVGRPQFAINCNDLGVRFIDKRNLSPVNGGFPLDGLCHHISYVMDDQSMLRKIQTWGHSSEFDNLKWYRGKWLKWYPSLKNLHPVYPCSWVGVAEITHKLPKELHSIVTNKSIYKPNLVDYLKNYFDIHVASDFGRRNIRVLIKNFIVYLALLKNLFLELISVGHRFVSYFTWTFKANKLEKRIGHLILHLGCGNSKKDGMLNCEIRATAATDVVMDCSQLTRFKTNSVAAIYSHAFLEHIYVDSRKKMLYECYRIISNDGYLIFLGLPDFEVVSNAYLHQVTLDGHQSFDLSMVYRYSHGAPESTAPGWWMAQLHKGLFDKKTLSQLIKAAGFQGGVLFNYCYPGENVPLCLGCISWKSIKPENINIEEILKPFSEHIKNMSDILDAVEYF